MPAAREALRLRQRLRHKHNNWSICADDKNLLEPGDKPEDNLQFLVFLACLVAAVDTHADLLRLSVASAGNDHRLGANEAPPAIISIFLGDALTPVVDALVKKEHADSKDAELMDLGVPALPDARRDNTDRNRTSPFAFTGNKFEFRMCGSQQNLSDPNVVLNTAVAEQCDRFVNYMDGVAPEDFTAVAMRFGATRSATTSASSSTATAVLQGVGGRRPRSAACSTSRPRPTPCPTW